MKVPGSLSLVFVNPALKKQLANLAQASAFLLCNLQKGTFDFGGDPEPNPFVFGCHTFGDSRTFIRTSQTIFRLTQHQ